MNTPIYDFLRNYSEKNPLRCHMPGHHGKHISEELAELYRHRETRYEVENEIRVRSMSRAQWAVCILIGMGTVTAVALLSRRDKEKE